MSDLSHETTGASPARRMSSLGRRGWMMAALAVVGTGTVFNWGWLTAIGAAPLILSLAPCAAMCALGLCMRGGSSSCAVKNTPAGKPDLSMD